jgi:hypothetical protein
LTCQADRSDRHHGHFRALSTILCHAALSLHHHNTPLHKCTLVQTLRFCTGRTAHRGSRGIALLFHDHSTRRGWGVSVTPRPLFTPGKDPVPIVQEAGWAPGQVWTGAENLAPTGIRSPDRPARSQSLYRLRFPAHFVSESVSTLYRYFGYTQTLTVGTLHEAHHRFLWYLQRNLWSRQWTTFVEEPETQILFPV